MTKMAEENAPGAHQQQQQQQPNNMQCCQGGAKTTNQENLNYNNLSQDSNLMPHPDATDFHKEAPPDLIKNILGPEKEKEKDYEKSGFNERQDNTEVLVKPQGKLVEVVDTEEVSKSKRRRRKLTRGICFMGWILCAPCFCMALAIRDDPEDDEDREEDPCLPWAYKT